MWQRLAEVGALYPGVGWEIPLALVVAGVCVGWMIWLIRAENAEYDEQVEFLRDFGGADFDKPPDSAP
jgi:hypothetical protein